jgi:hypothetical protein
MRRAAGRAPLASSLGRDAATHKKRRAHGLTALHPISLQPYKRFTQGREDEASNHKPGDHMKKLTFAFGAAVLLSLAALSAPAQAQRGGPIIQAQVYVVPPPPRRYYAPPPPPRYYGPRHYGPDRHYRDRRWDDRRHHGRRDNDRDGVPNRYDRRPNNPYRY